MRRSILPALVCLLLAGLPLRSHAEALDDASIRKFYADSTAIMRDVGKMQAFMEERMDSNFSLHENIVQIVNDNPPQSSSGNFDKTEAITNSIRGMTATTIENLENKIVEIKYSDDHKFAYVTDTTLLSGTIHMPAPDGSTATGHLEDGSGCVDRLALDGAMIKMMQSSCNEKIVIKK